MKLLLLSNSTNPGEPFLQYPSAEIDRFLGDRKHIAFLPFAAVRLSYDEYAKLVRERMTQIGRTVASLHEASDPVRAVEEADAVMVGGGNTFHLLKTIYDLNLLEPIRQKVRGSAPYIGWSAGSNIAAPTIKTTNDMPIVEPKSFTAFHFVPFQLNPHYTNESIPNLRAETRDDRLNEFIEVNPGVYVTGLREGTMLRVIDNNIELIGERDMKLFYKGEEAREIAPGSDISFLLQ